MFNAFLSEGSARGLRGGIRTWNCRVKLTRPWNFGRLVLGCIDADFCNKILIVSALFEIYKNIWLSFLRTAQILKFADFFLQNFAKFNEFSRFFAEFCWNLLKWYLLFFAKIFMDLYRNFTECQKSGWTWSCKLQKSRILWENPEFCKNIFQKLSR